MYSAFLPVNYRLPVNACWPLVNPILFPHLLKDMLLEVFTHFPIIISSLSAGLFSLTYEYAIISPNQKTKQSFVLTSEQFSIFIVLDLSTEFDRINHFLFFGRFSSLGSQGIYCWFSFHWSLLSAV